MVPYSAVIEGLINTPYGELVKEAQACVHARAISSHYYRMKSCNNVSRSTPSRCIISRASGFQGWGLVMSRTLPGFFERDVWE